MSLDVSFVEGLILGFGAAIPLGPINILIMNEALKEYKRAVTIGLGAMSADVTYLIIISFGISSFVKQALFLKILSLFGSLFLIYLSYLIFKERNNSIHKSVVHKKSTLFINYTKGYLLTLLNPYTILFWLSVTTYATTTPSLGLTLIGLISAILLWITVMPYIIYKKKALVSEQVSYIIALISSFVLFLFALLMLIKLLQD